MLLCSHADLDECIPQQPPLRLLQQQSCLDGTAANMVEQAIPGYIRDGDWPILAISIFLLLCCALYQPPAALQTVSEATVLMAVLLGLMT